MVPVQYNIQCYAGGHKVLPCLCVFVLCLYTFPITATIKPSTLCSVGDLSFPKLCSCTARLVIKPQPATHSPVLHVMYILHRQYMYTIMFTCSGSFGFVNENTPFIITFSLLFPFLPPQFLPPPLPVTRCHTFGIGGEVCVELVTGIAAASGGQCVLLSPGERLQTKVCILYHIQCTCTCMYT